MKIREDLPEIIAGMRAEAAGQDMDGFCRAVRLAFGEELAERTVMDTSVVMMASDHHWAHELEHDELVRRVVPCAGPVIRSLPPSRTIVFPAQSSSSLI